eukprot:gnl/MRDRNA2_/MRDRNA2_145871_c0_seq1.p1 gnl/MRDRNA2_/MRDRNA2_145871_c0~~gnl/MRDRNA2_/MRDRNA2_145871_c0_seq1.p1  ORF type:complete len:495 (+),score=87.80 gnl/MRDRNA2_/MRDRNA2_145871_c0_seq1:76-1485(+)
MGAARQQTNGEPVSSSSADNAIPGLQACARDADEGTEEPVEEKGIVYRSAASVGSMLRSFIPYMSTGASDAGSLHHSESQSISQPVDWKSKAAREEDWTLLEFADVLEDAKGSDDLDSDSPYPKEHSWEEVGDNIRILRGVPYGEVHRKQALDVYVPSVTDAVPVLVHMHGGGWKRGDRASSFYGAPAICLAAAGAGFVAVAPSYRLGKYPDFVEDAALALQWVYQHIAEYGGDVDSVFLSGHSAGAHIASLMLIRHKRFLQPLDIPMDFVKGLILMSGVYNLFNPIKEVALTYRNNVFILAYVLPCFGSDTAVRHEASPLLLLAPETNTTTEGAVRSLMRSMFGLPVAYSTSGSTTEVNDFLDQLPPVLIFNAEYDLGLEADGERMAAAWKNFTPEVQYVKVPGCNHASICWTSHTHDCIRTFMEHHHSKAVITLPSCSKDQTCRSARHHSDCTPNASSVARSRSITA